jgi:hypothetical protein
VTETRWPICAVGQGFSLEDRRTGERDHCEPAQPTMENVMPKRTTLTQAYAAFGLKPDQHTMELDSTRR